MASSEPPPRANAVFGRLLAGRIVLYASGAAGRLGATAEKVLVHSSPNLDTHTQPAQRSWRHNAPLLWHRTR
eukprot:scaffold50070_cov112-Isochrysis_galbana.AAC.2